MVWFNYSLVGWRGGIKYVYRVWWEFEVDWVKWKILYDVLFVCWMSFDCGVKEWELFEVEILVVWNGESVCLYLYWKYK